MEISKDNQVTVAKCIILDFRKTDKLEVDITYPLSPVTDMFETTLKTSEDYKLHSKRVKILST